MTMTTCYIAGPMRGIKDSNFPAFDDAAKYVRSFGWTAFSPAEHDCEMGFPPELAHTATEDDVREMFAWDCARICEVQVILLLPGWEHSTGAKAEVGVADMVGTNRWYYDPTAPWGERLYTDEGDMKRRADLRRLGETQKPGVSNAQVNHGAASGNIHRAILNENDGWAPPPKSPYRGAWPPREVQQVSDLLPPFFATGVASVADKEVTTGEVRTVNASTGGEKGSKDARYDLIPCYPLDTLARLYGHGAKKYAERNWERGYDWSLSFAALQRHAWAWWNGEETDPEMQLSHMAAVAFHAFALMQFAETHRELDDRG